MTNNSDGIDLRIDQHFSDRDSAFARYSYLDTDQLNPGPFPGIADGAVEPARAMERRRRKTLL